MAKKVSSTFSQDTINNSNGVTKAPQVHVTPQQQMAANLAPPAAAAAPTRAANPVVQPRSNYSVSTPTAATGATGAAATPAAAAPADTGSDQDYLNGDSTYQAALAGLKQTMSGYQSDHDQNLAKYDTSYGDGLKQLGFDPTNSTWNQSDTNTAYGRSFQNQLNDFGARDMLQSSFYGDSLNNMLRQFNDQKTGLDTSRQNYIDDQNSALNQETNENQQSVQQALAEAIARRAAGVSS